MTTTATRPKPSPANFRAGAIAADTLGVDRDHNIIRGYVVAEVGETKTKGRGEFDLQSLETLAKLGNANAAGVPMHFQHRNEADDGLGKFVGRAKNFRVDQRGGRAILRADAHISRTAMTHSVAGGTPYGVYLMDLADEDPGALQTSIVIPAESFVSRSGRPPIIRPTALIGSDFVQQGDAVHGDLFSADQPHDRSDAEPAEPKIVEISTRVPLSSVTAANADAAVMAAVAYASPAIDAMSIADGTAAATQLAVAAGMSRVDLSMLSREIRHTGFTPGDDAIVVRMSGGLVGRYPSTTPDAELSAKLNAIIGAMPEPKA